MTEIALVNMLRLAKQSSVVLNKTYDTVYLHPEASVDIWDICCNTLPIKLRENVESFFVDNIMAGRFSSLQESRTPVLAFDKNGNLINLYGFLFLRNLFRCYRSAPITRVHVVLGYDGQGDCPFGEFVPFVLNPEIISFLSRSILRFTPLFLSLYRLNHGVCVNTEFDEQNYAFKNICNNFPLARYFHCLFYKRDEYDSSNFVQSEPVRAGLFCAFANGIASSREILDFCDAAILYEKMVFASDMPSVETYYREYVAFVNSSHYLKLSTASNVFDEFIAFYTDQTPVEIDSKIVLHKADNVSVFLNVVLGCIYMEMGIDGRIYGTDLKSDEPNFSDLVSLLLPDFATLPLLELVTREINGQSETIVTSSHSGKDSYSVDDNYIYAAINGKHMRIPLQWAKNSLCIKKFGNRDWYQIMFNVYGDGSHPLELDRNSDDIEDW